MRHYSVIPTRSRQGLLVTLQAISVCAWAQVADCAHGVRISTGALWRQYLQSRADARAWRDSHPILWPDEQLDESAIESLARELGTPGWLGATLWAAVFAGVAIELVQGWPVVIDLAHAIGAALQRLARS